jgi:hypothetical protein
MEYKHEYQKYLEDAGCLFDEMFEDHSNATYIRHLLDRNQVLNEHLCDCLEKDADRIEKYSSHKDTAQFLRKLAVEQRALLTTDSHGVANQSIHISRALEN